MKKSKGRDDAYRLLVIEDYLSSGLSKYAIQKKYQLSDSNSILRWMRTFGMESPKESVIPEGIMRKKIQDNESEEFKQLRLELKKTQKELAYERMKSKAYDKMIDVAEEMFHIPIRKKPGAKQS